jgi:hypothetical protein
LQLTIEHCEAQKEEMTKDSQRKGL